MGLFIISKIINIKKFFKKKEKSNDHTHLFLLFLPLRLLLLLSLLLLQLRLRRRTIHFPFLLLRLTSFFLFLHDSLHTRVDGEREIHEATDTRDIFFFASCAFGFVFTLGVAFVVAAGASIKPCFGKIFNLKKEMRRTCHSLR